MGHYMSGNFCSKCNSELLSESSFCTFCGSPVDDFISSNEKITDNELSTKSKQLKSHKRYMPKGVIIALGIIGFAFVISIILAITRGDVSNTFLFWGILLFLAIFVFLIIAISKTIRKKPGNKKWWMICASSFVLSLTFLIIGALTACNHDYIIINSESPTCAKRGSTVLLCVLCDSERTEFEDALQHSFIEKSRLVPSCTNLGNTIFTCTLCSYEKTEQEEALQHDLSEISRTESTYEIAGEIIAKCIRCEFQEIEVLAMLTREHELLPEPEPEPEIEIVQEVKPPPEPPPATPPAPQPRPATPSPPQPEEKSEEDEFKESVLSAVQYNIDVAKWLRPQVTGLTTPNAGNYHELSGKLLAMRVNARLAGGDDLQKYRTMYYALHWRDKYIDEFGEDSYMVEAESFISSLVSANDIKLVNDFFIQSQEKQQIQNIQNEKEYKASAKTIPYDNLVRMPNDYIGQVLKVKIRVTQVMGEGGGLLSFLRDQGYHGRANNNEWYISYVLPDGMPRILEGDTVTFYGEFKGLTEFRRAIGGTRVMIPHLDGKYHE